MGSAPQLSPGAGIAAPPEKRKLSSKTGSLMSKVPSSLASVESAQVAAVDPEKRIPSDRTGSPMSTAPSALLSPLRKLTSGQLSRIPSPSASPPMSKICSRSHTPSESQSSRGSRYAVLRAARSAASTSPSASRSLTAQGESASKEPGASPVQQLMNPARSAEPMYPSPFISNSALPSEARNAPT